MKKLTAMEVQEKSLEFTHKIENFVKRLPEEQKSMFVYMLLDNFNGNKTIRDNMTSLTIAIREE